MSNGPIHHSMFHAGGIVSGKLAHYDPRDYYRNINVDDLTHMMSKMSPSQVATFINSSGFEVRNRQELAELMLVFSKLITSMVSVARDTDELLTDALSEVENPALDERVTELQGRLKWWRS